MERAACRAIRWLTGRRYRGTTSVTTAPVITVPVSTEPRRHPEDDHVRTVRVLRRVIANVSDPEPLPPWHSARSG
ncbi:hypothetical protein SMD44_07568 [Streptomyces alboflavus]|uniref:Uncharacterized protein n=1 Tax=Streptomyces alboflavus TaxID=67267 RepID=A0A1Z1WNR1_9ACTN|nr:hypothetical protein SMD44_07568 [Streptomyces alboflavus]